MSLPAAHEPSYALDTGSAWRRAQLPPRNVLIYGAVVALVYCARHGH
jgi:hypothetical protein